MRKRWPGPAPPRRPSYLFATLSDGGRELTDYHIHTLDTGLFKLLHLLFHCGFKSEVRCEEARPAPGRRRGNRAGCSRGWVGEEEEGSEGQAEPGCGAEDGRGTREERETPTQRKREERRQCERWAWPSCYHPDWHLPGVAKRPPPAPQGSEGMGGV